MKIPAMIRSLTLLALLLILLPGSAFAIQQALPDGDNQTGTWSTPPLWSKLNVPGDTTNSVTTTADANLFELSLGPISAPSDGGTACNLIVTQMSTGTGGPERYNWAILDGDGGATLLSASNVAANRDSWQTSTIAADLSAAPPSDWSNIAVTITSASIGGSDALFMGAVHLECLDPAAATPPNVSSTVPTNGATDVALNALVTINWDKNIDCATVNTTNITSDSPVWTLNTCSGSSATFNTGGQANSITYNVNVTTAVTDLVGTPMSAAYPFSYTTIAGDVTPPNVSSTVPTNGATGVALNAQVTVNWDESIDCATVNTTNITSDSPVWTLNTCSGSSATFNTGGQANSITYNVNVTTAVTDLSGNPMSAAYPFSYTTVAPGGSAPSVSTSTVFWIQTNVVSSVRDTTAKLGATIDSDGGAAITERGIVWSTTDNTPTIGEPGVTKVAEGGTAVGVFAADISSLTKATLTYFSGYATNSQGTGYSAVSTFYTEPDPAAAPTVDAPSGTNYFELTVNYVKPANADGVLVVARPTYAPKTAPYDGRVYTANSRVGAGDTTEPGCIIFCEYVVADDTASGSVTVTGLKDNLNHYFAVYAYKGSGSGISGINYVRTINATGPVITDTVPAAGKSHNELYVAQGGAGGTMTSADCANCHGAHHTSQLLPTGIDMYNKCFACHRAGGAADPKINIGMHLADGSVDCGTCHSMHSFREEELYSTNHSSTRAFNRSFVRANMKKYFNTIDGFPVDALEPTVFQNRPADFAFESTDPPYNAVCQTCHSDDAKTSHHQQDATDDHNFGFDCISCHAHRSTDEYNAFEPSGGHTAADFAWDAATKVSCGTVDCHDWFNNQDVAAQIHNGRFVATNAAVNNNCMNCHDNGSGGSQTTWLGSTDGDGDARLASAAPLGPGKNLAAACTVCHTKTRTEIHHTTTLDTMTAATAQNGACVTCHMPKVGEQSPLANRNDIMMPANLACNFCHLWWPNNTDYINQATDNGYNTTAVPGKVMIYRLTFDPVTNQRMMASTATLGSHAISENSTTPINDYGACFACHGATGEDNGRADAAGLADMIRPFHGLGNPVTSAVAVTSTTPQASGGSNSNYTMHVNNFFAGPQQTTTSAPVKTVPYNPAYAAFNFLALNVGTNQGGGTKPYDDDDNTFKFIHDSERQIRGIGCRNTTIGNTTSSIEYNNWGPDLLGGVGSITVNTGGVEGATTKNTVMPLVNLSLPTNIGPQAGCP